VEGHILDFDDDLYGERVAIEFVERLREQRTYDTVEALVRQIGKDVEQTRQILRIDA